ncbi:MAG: hypothetical protein JJE39_05120 [Vicinamibacteria bacterium]|nr:hypothetical protein [Vicinamibacteria bacterium]
MSDQNPAPRSEPPSSTTLTRLQGTTLSLLASLASLTLIGYRFGDSNHGITVPILKRFIDRSLYSNDILVATGDRFPTIFYQLLASFLPSTDWVPFAYYALYVISIALTYAAVYRMGVWASGGDSRVGGLAVLLAMPVRIALAGEALYRVAFSHSHLASGLNLMALALFLEGRRVLPLLILSLGVYNHALYSLYLLVPFTLMLLWEGKTLPRRSTLIRLGIAWLPVLPFLAHAAGQGKPMTREWLDLLILRSSHHSFPGTFGDALPDAVVWLLLGLAAATRSEPGRLRNLSVFIFATAILFVSGTILTEFIPVKAFLQFQPHRIWRFLSVILLVFMAADIVRLWRTSPLMRVLAAFYFLTVFATGLEQLGPLVLIAVFAANDPPLPTWVRLLGAVALVALEWPDRTVLWTDYLAEFVRRLQNPAIFAVLGTSLLVTLSIRQKDRRRALVLSLLAFALTAGPLVADNYRRQRIRFEQGSFRAAQNWARTETPKTAVFLTPPQEAGFRVFSERAIVGEWKDGTQQYFDDGFAREWGRRMETVMAQEFGKYSDAEIVALAREFGADYIVGQGRRRRLPIAFDGGSTVVYSLPSGF